MRGNPEVCSRQVIWSKVRDRLRDAAPGLSAPPDCANTTPSSATAIPKAKTRVIEVMRSILLEEVGPVRILVEQKDRAGCLRYARILMPLSAHLRPMCARGELNAFAFPGRGNPVFPGAFDNDGPIVGGVRMQARFESGGRLEQRARLAFRTIAPEGRQFHGDVRRLLVPGEPGGRDVAVDHRILGAWRGRQEADEPE